MRRGEPAGGEGRRRRSAVRETVDPQPAALERERLVEHGGEEEEGVFSIQTTFLNKGFSFRFSLFLFLKPLPKPNAPLW